MFASFVAKVPLFFKSPTIPQARHRLQIFQRQNILDKILIYEIHNYLSRKFPPSPRKIAPKFFFYFKNFKILAIFRQKRWRLSKQNKLTLTTLPKEP